MKPSNSKELALMLAEIAFNKKAGDIVILNLSNVEYAPAEYFVVCTCDSDNQVNAVITETKRYCNEYDMDYPRVEGTENSYWVIADFFDAVFHIMQRDARNYYRIENIWGDADCCQIDENCNIKPLENFDYLKQSE